MYHIDFTKPIHVHFIGIGGVSMSGLAELLHTKGFTISGSDTNDTATTQHLKNLGIHVAIGQSADNITDGMDLVVYTAAVHHDNPEYKAVIEKNIPIMDRATLVGQIMKHYKNAISISGTHGKTTTTSMIALMMLEGNTDPTISVGGVLENIKGNIRIGQSENFIVESCEYMDSFLSFFPTQAIILNVELEHTDYFKDLAQIRHSFRTFASKVPAQGNIVINGEIDQWEEIVDGLAGKVHTYGIFDLTADTSDIVVTPYEYTAVNLSFDNYGRGSYDLLHNGKFVDHICLGVVGRHNISNSLAAIALVDQLGVNIEAIKDALLKFTGTKRRFEKKGERNGYVIIDDYAHHPTEIRASLAAAKNYPHKDIWCVFQPHTYSRTKNLFPDFVSALSAADHIVLADIYAARENDPGDISSEDIQKKLIEIGKDAHYFNSFEKIVEFLDQKCTNGDLLITMGAGNVVEIGESLLKK